MAVNIRECMEEHGVNFIGECVPIRRQEAEARGRVTEFVDEFNTVHASPCTAKIWLEGGENGETGPAPAD